MNIRKFKLSEGLRITLHNPKAMDDALSTPDNGKRIAIHRCVVLSTQGGGAIATTNPLNWDVDRVLCQVM